MKNILLLNGNPKRNSFSSHLSSAYEMEAKKVGSIRRFNLSDMIFDPNLESGYDDIQALEPCLSDFSQVLIWADHIVIVCPIWWGGLPAKLKGLLDRTFLPGTMFKFEGESIHPIQLLTGKTSRIILTMDSPVELSEEQSKPVLEQLSRYTLEFCGVKKAEVSLLGSVILSDENQRDCWLSTVADLGSSCQ
ncbi:MULTISPECIES: NAD(P)H-dependent oxidoreductase [Vibrio]|uniref:Flavodoxin family protein n=1 Tax=Vibrio casei TaxID=673372 RepID=A0A368LNF6_9VIBR|nr:MULTISPECIES: NAD(P)H-dependent oxidoreductase [Vibrio]RCS73440.1 flavodoxin family protein [Vibrio casei]SJN24847.1 NAD(P)H dehydrogenase, quinone family [Vibrio casei]HBV77398.1 oxidoreductase [Vibrio sp.]